MKKWILIILTGIYLLSFPSCKKAVDNKIEDYIIKLMTSGNWYLEKVIEDGFDDTFTYSPYEFKFYENGKIDAIIGNTVESGVWSGDLSNKVFTSGFPNSGWPLNNLNHSWKITDAYVNVIFAEAKTSSGLISIRFRKK